MRRDLALMYSAQALRYLSPIILLPFYGRILGPDVYGQLLSAMALMQVAWILVEWGLPSTGLRNVAAAGSSQARGRLIGEQLSARLALALFVLPLSILVSTLVPALAQNIVVSILCISLGVTNAFNMTWYFQGMMQFRVASIMELVGIAMSTALILTLVREPDQVWRVPAILLAASGLSFIVQMHIVFKSTPLSDLSISKPVRAITESMLLFFDRGQAMLLGPISILLLGLVALPQHITSYAIAERLIGVISALLYPLNQIFAGRLAGSVAQMQQGASRAPTFLLMKKVCLYNAILYVLISIAAFLSANALIPVVFGQGFEDVIPIFRILCVAVLVLGAGTTLTATLLYPLRHDREIALLAGSRLAATVVLVALGGAAFGASGAAWGRTVGAVITLTLMMELIRRKNLLQVFSYRLQKV